MQLTQVDIKKLRKFKALLLYSQREIELFLEFIEELESRDGSAKRKSRKLSYSKMVAESAIASRRRKILQNTKKSK